MHAHNESKPPLEELALDWDGFRNKSLQPGGFGKDRIHIWPQLLNAKPMALEMIPESTEIHRDERQIGLDTNRSFVLYPTRNLHDEAKDALQSELHQLLVKIFRARPKLNYFQGYHDIISVLFLTLPQGLQYTCAEQLSLQRVRDSMGASLEPVLGLLRVLGRILRLADAPYADLLESNSPLPYYALSNLLTLFAHDMPTLPLIQHVFDYLLCRPPVAVVYLAAAIILSRKPEVQHLQEEDEDGMIHSLLSGLPNISDDAPSAQAEETEPVVKTEDVDISLSSQDKIKDEDSDATLTTQEFDEQDSDDDVSTSLEQSQTLVDVSDVGEKDHESTLIDIASSEEAFPPKYTQQQATETESSPVSVVTESPSASTDMLPPNPSPSPPDSLPSSPHHPPTIIPPPSPVISQPSIPLTSLLIQADALYFLCPPTHPSIALSSIMGPQSVVFTWSESPEDMPDPDDAESMVDVPSLVVLPVVESPPSPSPDSEKHEGKSKKQRAINRRGVFQRRGTMHVVAGAVLVLGVAVAVYGIRGTRPGGPVGGLDSLRSGRRWEGIGVGRWVGGVVGRSVERFFVR